MKQQLFDQEAVQEMATAVSLRRQLETVQHMMYLALGAVLTFLLFVFYISSLSGYSAPRWLRLLYLLSTAVYLLGIIGFTFFLRRRATAAPLFP